MGHSVTAFLRDAESGALKQLRTVSTLAPGTPSAGTTTAEIAYHPSGKWLYVSNRGCETISVLAIGTAEEFHLVLHTSPNSLHPSASLGYWKTLDEDYHWHIEIMPILAAKAKSYTFKEVYYSPVSSEVAVKRLREARIEGSY